MPDQDQNFIKFLTNEKRIPSKTATYYARWVNKFFRLIDKPASLITDTDLVAFSQTVVEEGAEEWQRLQCPKGVEMAVRFSERESICQSGHRRDLPTPLGPAVSPKGHERCRQSGGHREEGDRTYIAPLICNPST